MYWSHIVIEGYCFGEEDEHGKAPCGNKSPSTVCLGNGTCCPHFGWANSNEREASMFVPFYLILKDKIQTWSYSLWWDLRWLFWDRLWFNRRKVDAFFENIPVVTAKDSKLIEKLEKEQNKAQKKFVRWFSNESSRN